jgi:hypothetical protein
MTLSADNLVVQGFWHGPLTTMERLSMRSFLANGHEFHLYSYYDLEGVPSGVIVEDAVEILPYSRLADFRCPQQFSDLFRIALLHQRGGWYSDLDNVCLRPLDFAEPQVFYRDFDESTVSFALSKAPAGADFLQAALDHVNRLTPAQLASLPWQAIGSDLACGVVNAFGLDRFAAHGVTFDPVRWDRARLVVDPAATWDLADSYSLHLFHAIWNAGPSDRQGKGFDLGQPAGPWLDTDAEYPANCLYEQLKRRYLNDAA